MLANRLSMLICALVFSVTLGGCEQKAQDSDQNDVKAFFAKHKVGSSPDYAVMKNGTDHLMTIHGYADDLATCMQLIEPYNRDSSLSVIPGAYSCVPLNH